MLDFQREKEKEREIERGVFVVYHDDLGLVAGIRLWLVFNFQLLQSLDQGKAFVELAFGLFLYRFLRR